jgi:hypothetical protein
MGFNQTPFLSPNFLLFARKLAGVPPFPSNLDIIQFNSTTGEWELVSGVVGSAVQSSSNVGTGLGLALPRVLDDLPFKSLVAGSGIILTPSPTEILIASTSMGKIHIDVFARDDGRNWGNMPLAITEIFGRLTLRTKTDLDEFDQARLTVNMETIGNVGAVLFAEYDAGSGFVELADVANAGNVPIDTLGTLLIVDSGWFDIDSLAIVTDVTLRIVGEGGNGVIDPRIAHISLEFRAT